jgi:hypothetical protein
MSQYGLQKLVGIYQDLFQIVKKTNSVLKLSMKYVPISTKDGLDLHKQYDELKILLNKTIEKEY